MVYPQCGSIVASRFLLRFVILLPVTDSTLLKRLSKSNIKILLLIMLALKYKYLLDSIIINLSVRKCLVGHRSFSQKWLLMPQKWFCMMVNNPLSRGLGKITKVYLIKCGQSTSSEKTRILSGTVKLPSCYINMSWNFGTAGLLLWFIYNPNL